ncbi:MAG TPA: hypothetical protein VK966_12150, partial [Longimicrobiales bacterium]|nr:hypothetical protein [Longimicrobiales bacterium]
MSRRVAAFLAAPLVLLVLVAPPLLANGGTVRISRAPVGPYLVSVLSSPTPLRTGEVDISIMVQDSAESVAYPGVHVEARPVGFEADEVRLQATRGQATNLLFQAAKFDVPAAGEWEFGIRIEGYEERVSFRASVTEPTILDRPLLLAALVLLPLALMGWLFTRRESEP